MSASLDKAIFDEKFQINTILDFNEELNKPAREKMSKMVLLLDQKYSGKNSASDKGRLIEIADVELNMADYAENEYKPVKLIFKPKADSPITFEPGECFLELGLKGTFPNHPKRSNEPALHKSSTLHSSSHKMIPRPPIIPGEKSMDDM